MKVDTEESAFSKIVALIQDIEERKRVFTSEIGTMFNAFGSSGMGFYNKDLDAFMVAPLPVIIAMLKSQGYLVEDPIFPVSDKEIN